MAKTDTAVRSADEPKKKKKKKSVAAIQVKAGKGGKGDKGDKSDKTKKASRKSEGLEGLSRFVDHPLVADLLAAGAMAAVAAIAEHQLGDKQKTGSSKMVKNVGKAAATAMGRKLMSDIGAITTAATDAAKKA